jgi:hypothetical protein
VSDDFEARVERWLRERGEVDSTTLQSVAGHIALLPQRQRGRPGPWLAATAATVAAVAVAVAVGSLGLLDARRPSGGLPSLADTVPIASSAASAEPTTGRSSDGTLWLDANDQLAPPDTIHSSPGPGHCGWESMTFLWLDGAQYIRDPLGVLEGDWRSPFDPDADLPDDAIDTGYHTATWRMFKVPSGEAVYVQTMDWTFERWGRPREEVGCR